MAKYMDVYLAEHAEEISESHKDWLRQHSDHLREYEKNSYHTNPERSASINAHAKTRYRKDPITWSRRTAENAQKRKAADPVTFNAKVAASARRRLQNNATARISSLMSNRVMYVLRSRGTKKAGTSWLRFVDYTVDQLVARLESTLPQGYTIDDVGRKLDIDHIRPVRTFAFQSPHDAEFRACWALENLQLLTKASHKKKTAADLRRWPLAPGEEVAE